MGRQIAAKVHVLLLPVLREGTAFQAVCHWAVQIQTGNLWVFDSSPLIYSNNRRKIVLTHRQGGVASTQVTHWDHPRAVWPSTGGEGLPLISGSSVRSECSAPFFHAPVFHSAWHSSRAPTDPPVAHSLQQAPAKPQAEERQSLQDNTGLLNSGWRRQTTAGGH